MLHICERQLILQTVYRANEINVHAVLKYENIFPLMAALMGEKHERQFYCFHFMPKMDHELRQILSAEEVGYWKYAYKHSSICTELEKWDTAYGNIKFVLVETLKALAYLHKNGYVHWDVKGSFIYACYNQLAS